MTYTSEQSLRPKALKVSRAVDTLQLIVHGQGVVLFDASGPCSLTFVDGSGAPGLRVSFTETGVSGFLLPSNEPLIDPRNSKGLSKARGACYWVSLDSQNQRLYAGVGEARIETMTYVYELEHVERNKQFLESLCTVRVESLSVTRLLRDPITASIPLKVKTTGQLTMEDIASGLYMPKVNLSAVSQKLHDCIAGEKFVLDGPDFPYLTQAIEASIATPGRWCYERLKQKATEFNKDKPDAAETYLRITLGENNGESPGIPYVMEIWPVGHYSPIHNHGGASAIIRVLHGNINVSLFPFLSGDELMPFAKADFGVGDVTWISPTLNQVHQLHNLAGNKDTCITIQCYMYETADKVHYDYFDYLDATGEKQKFEPDSDMDFLQFKALMKKEWAELKRWRWCC